MGEEQKNSTSEATGGLNPALGLAILGGLAIGTVILMKSLPTRHLSRSDMERLLFYRYLREKGKLES